MNQLLDYSTASTGPLTHCHVITQIAIALSISQSSLSSMRCVRMIHFTKQAFTRGEVIDAHFNLKHAHKRSCWIKREQTLQTVHVVEEVEEEHDDHDHNASEEGKEQSPSTNVTIGEGGFSAPHDLALWQQVLDGQRVMMQQME